MDLKELLELHARLNGVLNTNTVFHLTNLYCVDGRQLISSQIAVSSTSCTSFKALIENISDFG